MKCSPPLFQKLAVFVEFAGHLVGNKIDDAEGQNHFAHTFCGKQFLETKHVL